MITADHLQGLPGLGQAAKDALLSTQPATVAAALQLRGVGRKATRTLRSLGLLTDPEGAQTRAMAQTKRRKQANDPYEEVVDEHWDSIVEVFRQFEDKSPVILFDVQEQRIYAYPHKGFAAELSAKDQAALARQHEKVVAGKSIIVFVRDNERRKLVSFTFARQAA